MKKLLMLILTILICTCSDDDDSNKNTQDPIIGVWKPNSEIIVYTDDTENSEAPSACELNNRLNFENDGHFYMTDYPEGNDPNCEELIGNLFLSGNWTRVSEGKYVIELICYLPNCDEIIEKRPDEVTFPNNTKMRMKYSDDDPDISYHVYIYDRVE